MYDLYVFFGKSIFFFNFLVIRRRFIVYTI